MIHINGVGYCNESGAQMAVNDLLKVNQQQAEQIAAYKSSLEFAQETIKIRVTELLALKDLLYKLTHEEIDKERESG